MSVHIYDMCGKTHRLSSDLLELVALFQKSPLAQGLYDFAVENNLVIETDVSLDCGESVFQPHKNKLILGKRKNRITSLLGFISGLRRVWHYYQGNEPEVFLKPEYFLKYNKCLEADIENMVLYACWQLRIAGHPSFWREYLSDVNGDIGLVFLRSMEEHPEKQFGHYVLKISYNQWFTDPERVKSADHDALECFDLKLCSHLERYSQKGESLKVSDLQKIGTLPFGGNYLENQRFAGKWYNSLNDPLNKAYLQHIKKEIY